MAQPLGARRERRVVRDGVGGEPAAPLHPLQEGERLLGQPPLGAGVEGGVVAAHVGRHPPRPLHFAKQRERAQRLARGGARGDRRGERVDVGGAAQPLEELERHRRVGAARRRRDRRVGRARVGVDPPLAHPLEQREGGPPLAHAPNAAVYKNVRGEGRRRLDRRELGERRLPLADAREGADRRRRLGDGLQRPQLGEDRGDLVAPPRAAQRLPLAVAALRPVHLLEPHLPAAERDAADLERRRRRIRRCEGDLPKALALARVALGVGRRQPHLRDVAELGRHARDVVRSGRKSHVFDKDRRL